MKKFLLVLLVFFTSFNHILSADEINLIDGRSQHLIDNEESIDPSYFISYENDKNLFEIVNFKNISLNKDDNIKNYRGKIVILHFWATWCGYCIDEMKSLDKLASILKKKEIEDIIILPVSIDSDNSLIIKDFYKEMNIKNLSIYQDQDNKYLPILARTTLPTTFIIGRNGKQLAVANSSVPWDNSRIVNYLEELL